MDKNDWLQRLFNKVDEMDTEGFLSFLTSDVLFRFGNGPEVTGRENVKAAISSFFESIKGVTHCIQESWDQSDTVICKGEVTYTRLDESMVTIPFVNIFEMQNECISKYLIYIDITPLYSQKSQQEICTP